MSGEIDIVGVEFPEGMVEERAQEIAVEVFRSLFTHWSYDSATENFSMQWGGDTVTASPYQAVEHEIRVAVIRDTPKLDTDMMMAVEIEDEDLERIFGYVEVLGGAINYLLETRGEA